MHAVSRVAVVLLLAAVSTLVGAQSQVAAADASWEVKPAATIFGSNRPSYSYTLPRGGQLKDALVVVNRGKTPLVLSLYGADAFTTDEGQLELLGRDSKSTDIGSWVQLSRSTVKVPPGQSVDVPFRVALPDTAAPGDHLGGIVTSVRGAGTSEQRVGIKIRLRVSGELRPALAVEDLKVHYSGTPNPFGTGSATVTYTVHNTGNAIVAARQAASVTGPFGLYSAHPTQLADSPQLLPGESWKVSTPIHGVPPAIRLTGTVSVVPLLRSAAQPASAATTHTLTIPWTLLLLIAACTAAAAFLITRHRHRRRPAHAR
ncbi:DUF916 domain-containing protein [Streptomyces sp. SID13031]|uniref:WxL protein peptidoglycan domain-containing protein n=1 Tax=Streptomyces sp. SID13031 TaxID=2706046 RepID=UPI0013C8D319|nr:DUF916 domain-containing protein [Streptomyces sp. SID13031]NEA31444.1 DUF916 domain-containing protein [Streptomyces sp. SID13031]